MKRPFGFDSAIDAANHDDGFANMSISKGLILELDNYICQLEVKCDATQPRKTVSDAVEHYKSEWKGDRYDAIAYNNDYDGFSHYSLCDEINEKWCHVCTREEFEAEVERRNSTPCKFNGYNKVAFGSNCKVVCGPNAYGDHVIEMESTLEWRIVLGDAISERKPTISKAEAWDKLMEKNMNSSEVNTIKRDYDIV